MIKPLGIYLESIAQNKIGHLQWGAYSAVHSLGLILSVVLNPGFQQFLTLQIAQGRHSNLLGPIQKLQAILFPLYVVLFLTIGWLLDYGQKQYQLIIIISLLFYAIHAIALLRAKLQGTQAYKLDAWLSNIDKTFFISGLIICLTIDKTLSLSMFLLIKTLSVYITLSLLQLLIKRNTYSKDSNRGTLNYKNIIMQSIPFTLTISLNNLHERVDMIMLYELHGGTATGIYSATYRIYDGLMMYLWIIGPYIFSRIAFQHKDPKKQIELLQNGTTLLTIPLLFLAAFSIYYGELFFYMFDDNAELTKTMHSVLNWLFIPLILNAICVVPVSKMMSQNQFRPITTATIVAVVINITLNSIYIPAYGVKAAAITTGISTASISLVYIIHNSRRFSLPIIYWTKILAITLPTVLCFAIAKHFQTHWITASLSTGLIISVLTLKIKLFTTK